MNEYSPIVSEFESAKQEADYLAWLNAKVAGSIADPRPPLAHDQAMSRIRATLAKHEQ